jgi:hypothetical protein
MYREKSQKCLPCLDFLMLPSPGSHLGLKAFSDETQDIVVCIVGNLGCVQIDLQEDKAVLGIQF